MHPMARFSDRDTLHRTRRCCTASAFPPMPGTVASRGTGGHAVPRAGMAGHADDALRPAGDPGHRRAHPEDTVTFAAAPGDPGPGILAGAMASARMGVIAWFAAVRPVWWHGLR